jgi:hypothetical protein
MIRKTDIKVLTAFFALLPLIVVSGIKLFIKVRGQMTLPNKDMWE